MTTAPAGDAAVLEMKDLHVGYYRDLNIIQNLNIKARKKQVTAVPGCQRGREIDSRSRRRSGS